MTLKVTAAQNVLGEQWRGQERAARQRWKVRKSEEANAEATVVTSGQENTARLVSSVTLCRVGCGLKAALKCWCRK